MKNYILLTIINTLFLSNLSAQWSTIDSTKGLSSLDLYSAQLRFHPQTKVPHILYVNSRVNYNANGYMKKVENGSLVSVGDSTVNTALVSVDHLAFEFNPNNANVPIVYFFKDVVQLNGLKWDSIPGLQQYTYTSSEPFAFDVSSTGNPTVAFADLAGNAPYGRISVVRHDGTSWKYLGIPRLSHNSGGSVQMEYSPVNNKLYLLHHGGFFDSNYNANRVLMQYSGTWDSIACPKFQGPPVSGKMKINPVTGDIYIYALDYINPTNTTRLLRIFKWNGTQMDSISCYNQIKVNSIYAYDLSFHPTTGELHILYLDNDKKDVGTGLNLYNLKRFNGSQWVETDAGKAIGLDFVDFVQQMKIQPGTGDIYVVGTDKIKNTQGGNGYVMKYKSNDPSNLVNQVKETFTIYPNPAEDYIQIEGDQLKVVKIYNLLGELVLTSNAQLIDVSALAGGIYTVQIISNSNTSLYKQIYIAQ